MTPPGYQTSKEGHEGKDIDVFGVALVAALVFVIVAISLLAAGGMLRFTERGRERRPEPARRAQFPRPGLEIHPGADLAAARAANEAELHSYGWIDRRSGAVHIPIERAMELLVERGLPEVGAGQTPLQLMQARPGTNAQPDKPAGSPTPGPSPP